ncbi:MAG: TolC family protein [Acidobacteriota bacterium]|nr:TolC family protein [Acidobacteriota bacterium]
MLERIFCLRKLFIFILRIGLIATAIFYLSFAARAQTPTPTPISTSTINPTATASPTPVPTVSPTPPVKDAQNVEPENLQGVPAIATGFESNNRELPELGRVGVDMLQPQALSLRDALERALSNNKDIEITRQNVRIAEFDLTAAQGFYEPRFAGTTNYERATVPNVSIFSGQQTSTTQQGITGNLRFEGFTPAYGGNYRVEFNSNRLTTNNVISPLSPQYQSNLTFIYIQPLFRGRSFDQPRRQIEIAKKNLSLTDAQFRQRTIEIIASVQRAYWDLTFALKNLQVQRDAVRDAKNQLEHNRRLVQEGLVAPVDVLQVETQVANFEQSVYEALNTVAIAENNLKNLIAQNQNDNLWAKSLVPTDTVNNDLPIVSLPDALTAAMSNRPELETNNVAREINELDQRFYREQTKPQVDLTASYTAAGIAGQQNPDLRLPFNTGQTALVSPDLTGSYLNSVTDIAALRYPTFRVGVTVNLPFESKTARAQLGRSLVEGERLTTQREQLEQAIQVDVRNSLQLVRTAEARLRSAAIARENNEKQYESEQRKLENGQSTVYLVLERQTQLANARGAELRAQTELNKAIAELQRATGNSLRANNIVARLK